MGDTNKMNIQVGSTTTALQNKFAGVGGVIDIELANFNNSTTFNLFQAGSTSTSVTTVIQQDNPNGPPSVDDTAYNGTITIVTPPPAQPPQPPVVAP